MLRFYYRMSKALQRSFLLSIIEIGRLKRGKSSNYDGLESMFLIRNEADLIRRDSIEQQK